LNGTTNLIMTITDKTGLNTGLKHTENRGTNETNEQEANSN